MAVSLIDGGKKAKIQALRKYMKKQNNLKSKCQQYIGEETIEFRKIRWEK